MKTHGPRSHWYPALAGALAVAALMLHGCAPGKGRAKAPVKAAKLLIEHNATDEDTGFQGFVDAEPWNQMTLTGPGNAQIATITAAGGLLDFGLTELFFETNEPANDEVPIEDVLALLPTGAYRYAADLVEGGNPHRPTPLTHDIPAGPELVSPADGATGVDAANTVIAWQAVVANVDDGTVSIVGYQVIVQDVESEGAFPQTFAQPQFSAYLPASATSITVPAQFMRVDTCYKYEVLAIETSGNQTLSSAAFGTGAAVCLPEVDGDEEEPALNLAKLLIEHNATDLDTGFQGFADGDPWSSLTISGPNEVQIVRVTPQGTLQGFGLTELFFETDEPENAEVPIATVLSRLPEGDYTFRAELVGGAESTRTATLTHSIPNGPVLVAPADEATDVDAASTVVSWQPVTTNLAGAPVTIVGYQVIVEEDRPEPFPNTFAKPMLSIHIPADVTQVTIPAAFMRSETDYVYEVLAIEESGNQTLSSAKFRTQ